MSVNKDTRIFYIFLLIWLLLNVSQATITELIHDEAYYWFYTLHMGWGYFDHPPAVAWMIWPGTQLINGELGVRLFSILLSATTLWLAWRIIRPERPLLMIAILTGMVVVHLGGFLAAPDIPLVFFSAVFFLSLKHYLDKDNWLNALVLGLALTGMAYSKYNGVLLFVFTLLPNLRLLRRRSFWLIVSGVILTLLPHLYWQYEHDFATFRFHFFDRSPYPYTWKYALEYPLSQLLMFGPFLGFILFPAALMYKSRSRFEQSLQWSLWGVFGFFLFRSLGGPVEANWTSIAFVPLAYLSYHFISERTIWRNWTFALCIAGLVLIMTVRLYLAYDFLPHGLVKRNETHGWEQWAHEIEEVAGDLPVLFSNNYIKPSKYMFYTGRFAHSINDFAHAGKHYDLIPEVEASLQGDIVFHIRSGYSPSDTLYLTNTGMREYHIDSNLRYFNRVAVCIPKLQYEIPAGATELIDVKLENRGPDTVDFREGVDSLPAILFCLYWYGTPVFCEPAVDSLPVTVLAPGESVPFRARIYRPKEPGDHWRFRFVIKSKDLLGRNSPFTDLECEVQ